MQDISDQKMIDLIKDLSPLAQEYLNTKAYLTKIVEDDVTDIFLLIECYKCLLEELEDIGISFHCELEELFEDMYTAEAIYHLRKILEPEFLYEFFKMNKELAKAMENQLENNTVDTELISFLLDTIYLINENNYSLNRTMEIEDKFVSTEKLRTYIKTIVDIANINRVDDLDMPLYLNLIEIVKKDRLNFEYVVNYICKDDQSLNYEKLKSKIKNYDLSKLNGDNANMYAWCYTDGAKEMNPFIYNKYMDIHHTTSTHHIEYWLTHADLIITKESLVELVSHHFAIEWNGELPIINEEAINKVVDDINEMITKAGIRFNESHIEYIIYLISLIKKIM